MSRIVNGSHVGSIKKNLSRIFYHVGETQKGRKRAMTTLEVTRVERLDRFRLGDARGRSPLRMHNLARRARGETDLPRNLSLGPCSERLQVELPPHAAWRDSLHTNMRVEPV